MKYLQDIANLIEIRNFLSHTYESMSIALTKEETKAVYQRIQLLNKNIIERSLKMDLSELDTETKMLVREYSVNSSEDTKVVMERMMGVSGVCGPIGNIAPTIGITGPTGPTGSSGPSRHVSTATGPDWGDDDRFSHPNEKPSRKKR